MLKCIQAYNCVVVVFLYMENIIASVNGMWLCKSIFAQIDTFGVCESVGKVLSFAPPLVSSNVCFSEIFSCRWEVLSLLSRSKWLTKAFQSGEKVKKLAALHFLVSTITHTLADTSVKIHYWSTSILHWRSLFLYGRMSTSVLCSFPSLYMCAK